MNRSRREQVFANGASFSNIAYGPWDAIDIGGRVWEVGEYSRFYKRLTTFLCFVLDTDEVAFDIGRRAAEKITRISSRPLASCYNELNCLPDICFSGYTYSPDVRLFLDCYVSHREVARCASIEPNWYAVDGWIGAEIFNDFVAYMRHEAKRRGLKKAMHNWVYGTTKREEAEIRAYLRSMWNKSTKLLAIRFELEYREQATSGDDVLIRERVAGAAASFTHHRENGAVPETAARFDPARALDDRNRFLDGWSGKDKELFEHCIGYLGRTEQGGTGVIHHHILLVFDGQRVKDEFEVLDRVGGRWEAITRGAGYMHSTHLRRADLIRAGKWHYGRIDSPEGLEAMIEDAAAYFTKGTQLLRIKPTPHARTLVKGQPHEPRVGGPGRPRKAFGGSVA